MPEVVINNFPQTITADPFNVDVTIKGAKNGTNYLRIELFKDGNKNYFGETFNGKDWNNDLIGEDYFPIEIKSASVSATVKARIGNPNGEEYLGPGNYKLKIKRYTQSGSAATDSENAVDIKINYETPTPINSPAVITQTQTPVATQIDLINQIPTVNPTVLVKPTITSEVLAYETEISPKPTITVFREEKKDSFSLAGAVVFFVGLFLLGISFYIFYTSRHAPSDKKIS